jgi:hypothetical protein
MVLSAAMYLAMMAFPPDFSYVPFAVVMVVSGIAMGLFASPNTSSIMNALPARERGVGSGMRVTFGNAGTPLSMGLFFTLMVFGLNAKVPSAMYRGLVAHGVPSATATELAHQPPLGYLFAAFLGYNPLGSLLGPKVLGALPHDQAALLTSRAFFPELIGAPFKHGLVLILTFAVVMSLVAAVASALRGKRFVHEEAGSTIDHGHLRAVRPPDAANLADAVATGPSAGDGSPGGGGAGQRRPDGAVRTQEQRETTGPEHRGGEHRPDAREQGAPSAASPRR